VFRLPTALGDLAVEAGPRGVRRIAWPASADLPLPDPDWAARLSPLQAFLAGEGPFPVLEVDLEGLPPFHQAVYRALHATAPGQVLTYGALALLAGSPGAARAVGQAMRTNPIPLLVPCHRVVASQGPGGYSFAGGMALKARLMALEQGRAVAPELPGLF